MQLSYEKFRKLTLVIIAFSHNCHRMLHLCRLIICVISCLISRCCSFHINRYFNVYKTRSNNIFHCLIEDNYDNINNDSNNYDGNPSKGFGKSQDMSEAKRPPNKVLKPSLGTKSSSVIEKFLMMYTCKICSGRNAQMVRASSSCRMFINMIMPYQESCYKDLMLCHKIIIVNMLLLCGS